MADHNEAMRLADSIKTRAVGWTEWRVENPIDGGYVMVFTQAESLWPEKEAKEWLELHKQHHPNSMYADYVVAKHHCYSRVEQDALDAAALLRQQAERIAELQSAHDVAVEIAAQYAAERDQLRAEVERLGADGERYRKLRQQHEEADSGLTLCVFRHVNDSTLEPVGSMPGELDAEIDAARTTHKETE